MLQIQYCCSIVGHQYLKSIEEFMVRLIATDSTTIRWKAEKQNIKLINLLLTLSGKAFFPHDDNKNLQNQANQ